MRNQPGLAGHYREAGRQSWEPPRQHRQLGLGAAVGITWNPSPKWVIRSGFGIFYNQDTGNPRFDMARNLAGVRDSRLILKNLYTFQTAFLGSPERRPSLPRPYAFANEYNGTRRTPFST